MITVITAILLSLMLSAALVEAGWPAFLFGVLLLILCGLITRWAGRKRERLRARSPEEAAAEKLARKRLDDEMARAYREAPWGRA